MAGLTYRVFISVWNITCEASYFTCVALYHMGNLEFSNQTSFWLKNSSSWNWRFSSQILTFRVLWPMCYCYGHRLERPCPVTVAYQDKFMSSLWQYTEQSAAYKQNGNGAPCLDLTDTRTGKIYWPAWIIRQLWEQRKWTFLPAFDRYFKERKWTVLPGWFDRCME